MASQVEICNLALTRIGDRNILSIDDNVKSAIVLKNIFGLVRDVVLRDHPWNFATKRVSLARLADAPAWGFAYAYQLPSDCLRVLGIQNPDDPDPDDIDPTMLYKVEGDQVLTDNESVYLKYIYRVDDTAKFDARFSSALASRLAAEVSYYLSGSATMRETMIKEYQMELSGARSIDAQENPPDLVEDNVWGESRI